MAENTVTALIPDVYEALDIVSRELTGLIPAVTMSASADRVAKGQNIDIDVEPAYSAGVDITPAMVVPDPVGETSAVTTITISNSKSYSFGFNGEDQKGIRTGAGYLNVRANKIAQRIRTLVNEVEADLAALQSTFSRAYGTSATTPFGTAGDFTDATQAKRILLDNGAPEFDNQLVMNTAAGAILTGKQASANVAGTDSIQRQGILLPLAGLDLRQSAQIVTNVAGLGANYTSATAGFAVGITSIPIITGTGTVLAGDYVTFTNDTNKYLVTTGVTAPGTIVIAAPGLRKAIAASAVAMTVGAAAARNMVFNRSALILAARAPARPVEGDLAEDSVLITDPRSGLTFEFSMYKGYRKVRYEIALAWGVKNIKPEHTAILLG